MLTAKSVVKYLSFFMLVGLATSCRMIKDLDRRPQFMLPTAQEMPTSFTGSTDSLSIGDLSWQKFFNDQQLVELIDLALQNNQDLKAAIQRIEIARANYEIANGALLPSLDARFRVRTGDIYNNLLNNTIYGDRNTITQTQNHFLGLQSTWEIDLWGRLRSLRRAAHARFLASEKGRQLVTTALVAEVASQYYELMGLDIELETIRKNIELQEAALEIIKVQKGAGRATELAVQQFQAQLLQTQSLSLLTQQRIMEVENQINLLLGRYPQPIARGESILKQDLPEVIQAGIPAQMLLRRPDIQQAELELLAARADIDAARAAFLPSLAITPYVGFHSRTIPTLFSSPQSVVLGMLGGLTAPIFQNRVIRSNYQRTSAITMEGFYNYQQRILEGHQEVVSNLQRVEKYKQVYQLREQETEVLLMAVSTSNELYLAGYATYLEVITAQRRVLEAELEKTNTRKEVFLSIIDLYRALGGGWK